MQLRTIGASTFSAACMAEAVEVSRKNGLPRYEVLERACLENSCGTG
jgi:hypothetical protein